MDSIDVSQDNRNVIDSFKGWHTDIIKAKLDTKRHSFVVAVENFLGDYNLGSVVRNCNAFSGQEVFYFGRKHWDKRGAVGSQFYEHVTYVNSIDDVIATHPNMPVIGIDNVPGYAVENIHDFNWPKTCILVFGEESVGLTENTLKKCDQFVYIPQYGSVRSINAAAASAVAMSYWCKQWADPVNQNPIG